MNIRCDHCGALRTINKYERRTLDSSGPFLCSASCIIRYAHEVGNPTPDPLKLKNFFASAMDPAFEAYSKVLKMGFRSGYEVVVAEWLTKYNIQYLYEPYLVMLSETTSLSPDFYLPQFGVFLEVKGQWQGCSKSKMRKYREADMPIPIVTATWIVRKSFGYTPKSQGTFK